MLYLTGFFKEGKLSAKDLSFIEGTFLDVLNKLCHFSCVCFPFSIGLRIVEDYFLIGDVDLRDVFFLEVGLPRIMFLIGLRMFFLGDL